MRERRSTSRIAIRYGTSAETLARIPELLRSAVEKHEHARFDHAHLVSLGDHAYEYELTFLTPPDAATFLDVQQAVMLDVVRSLEAEGLAIAERERSLRGD
jgi:MscS family membrane protein